MNFLELVKRLRDEAGLSDDMTDLASLDGVLERFPSLINQAYAEILADTRWRFAWEETDATLNSNLYETPDWAGDFDSANVFVNGILLTEINYDQVRRGHAPQLGETIYFARKPSGDLVFCPAPIYPAALQIDLWRQYHMLVLDADEPIIPLPWRDVIIWKALMAYAASDAASELYSHASKQYLLRNQAMCNKFAPAIRFKSVAIA